MRRAAAARSSGSQRMPITRAGILMFRHTGAEPEVLPVHPRGPYSAKNDDGAWSSPKGVYQSDEDALVAARREFEERKPAGRKAHRQRGNNCIRALICINARGRHFGPRCRPWEEERPMTGLPSSGKECPAAGTVFGWWYDQMRAGLALLDPLGGINRLPDDPGVSGFEIPEFLGRRFDADLLFRRMALLRIDRDALEAHDPLLFHELQGECTLCRHKERCARDLSREPEDAAQDWHDYCPNCATLNLLAVIQDSAPRALPQPSHDRSVPAG
jgi:hypothetical protein